MKITRLNKACTLLAIALTATFLLCTTLIFVPAHQGPDQNGYLVGGKLLAQNGSMAYRTDNTNTGEPDPFLFVGHMWVGFDLDSAEQRYYPKYPIGLPLMVATVVKIAGPETGAWLAYWISPLCMALALLAVYFLIRLVAHPLLALIACAFMLANPIVLNLSNNPNSHAADLLCVSWGMYFLLLWWQENRLLRAVAAGFLLGLACTIRYTEALLLLPLLLVVWMNHHAQRTSARTILKSAVPLMAWALPVTILLAHNLIAFGSITAYGPTNESTGFAWGYFVSHWDTMLRQLSGNALGFLFPFALAGLIAMFWWSWRLALVLTAWAIPTTLLYTSYYWAPDSIRYARFFLTVVPAFLMCAFWFLNQLKFSPGFADSQLTDTALDSPLSQPGAALPAPAPSSITSVPLLIASLVTFFTIAVSLTQSLPAVALDYSNRKAILTAGNTIKKYAAPGSVIVSQDKFILNHLQFISDFRLYSLDSFDKRRIEHLPVTDPNVPQNWQPQQRQMLYDHLKDLSQKDLDNELQGVFRNALGHGQDVFFIKREEDSLLLSPAIAPPEEFSTRIAATWFPANPMPAINRIALERKRTNPRPQLSWQLIQITARPAAAN